MVSKVPIVKSNMCQVVLRRDPFDEQTEGQASKSSSWDWEQFAKYLPIGRFCERSIGRNRIGFPHINICQVFLRDLEHTHTHLHTRWEGRTSCSWGSERYVAQGGAEYNGLSGYCRQLYLYCVAFYQLAAIVFVLHCIVW